GCIDVTIEFSGGAELLVGKQKIHKASLPSNRDWTIRSLLPWIAEHLMKTDRPELLIENGTVRPGILVLVNDTDWELLGELSYVIKPNDTITFISTLHGG
uniref:Ubiquitin-related modifier 1 homolog n=1 Tax=Plectus sambesii TaxID=2011161 RepID=A0A914V7E9_9BILA